jgi:hypothetical protein
MRCTRLYPLNPSVTSGLQYGLTKPMFFNFFNLVSYKHYIVVIFGLYVVK